MLKDTRVHLRFHAELECLGGVLVLYKSDYGLELDKCHGLNTSTLKVNLKNSLCALVCAFVQPCHAYSYVAMQ